MKALVLDDDQVELLIEEVERRPILYDKHIKGYSDNAIKKKEWDEICVALLGDETWASMDTDEKKEAGYHIRKRWLNLRNCFARELRQQRLDTPKTKGKKRRKYCYFDQLMFLMPSIELRETAGSGNENSDDNLEPEYIDTSSPPHNHNIEPTCSDIQMGDPSLNLTSRRTDCDEDKLFVMSLVPQLRRLTDYEKLDMKVKILNLFKSKYRTPFTSDYNGTIKHDIKARSYTEETDED
ncbi:uncharacterized protein [Epargyreus clarus]|uniref:uncharacterized protein n=1 Tax=Epargyreus clarus TaxID=520877 RepID=UPI003C2DC88A